MDEDDAVTAARPLLLPLALDLAGANIFEYMRVSILLTPRAAGKSAELSRVVFATATTRSTGDTSQFDGLHGVLHWKMAERGHGRPGRPRGGGVHSLKASGFLPSHVDVDVDVDLASVHRSALPALSGKLLGMHNDTMMQQKYSGVGRYRSIGK